MPLLGLHQINLDLVFRLMHNCISRYIPGAGLCFTSFSLQTQLSNFSRNQNYLEGFLNCRLQMQGSTSARMVYV